MAYAIILLSGSSTRFNGETPKQFTLVNGKPLFMYSLDAFLSHPKIEKVVLVTLKNYIDFVKGYLPSTKPVDVIAGGNTRRESSYFGIKQLNLSANDNSKVLIHDAARPLVTYKMIDDVLNTLDHCCSCTIASSTNNTLIDLEGNYLDRNLIKSIETPQGFIYCPLLKAHETVNNNATDDTMLLKEIGYKTELVMSNSINIKVTNKDDLLIVKAILEEKKG